MTARERAKKMVNAMNEAPMILPEGVSFCDWVEDKMTAAIEEAERAVREEVLEYAGMADWD